MATPIISNEEMNDIMKIVNSLEDGGLSIKGVSEIIKNEAIFRHVIRSTSC